MGNWLDDKRQGYGVLRSSVEGWRFLCLWKDDKKHGRGIFVCSKGLYCQTIFSFDQLLDQNGLLFDQQEDEMSGIEETRIFIGAISTNTTLSIDTSQPEEGTVFEILLCSAKIEAFCFESLVLNITFLVQSL